MEISVTVLLIALTCLSSYYAWNTPAFMGSSMFTPYRIRHRGEYGRFLLSGFIHKDGTHLLFNMFTFYFFGEFVEQYLAYRYGVGSGAILFVGFYLVAIVVSNVPTFWKEKNNLHYHALGASGGTAAMVFASIVLSPLAKICIFGILCLPGFILGGLFLAYSIYKGKVGGDQVNHDAHLFGALFGILFILVLWPSQAFNFWEEIKSFRLF